MNYFTVSIGFLNPEYDGSNRRIGHFRTRLYAEDKQSARHIGIRAFEREHIGDGDFISVRVQQVR